MGRATTQLKIKKALQSCSGLTHGPPLAKDIHMRLIDPFSACVWGAATRAMDMDVPAWPEPARPEVGQ
ncbi:hypothetical protein TRIHO_38680 [Tritonibacter horizontis]|uniref:Uncharacterized protein n=1 Tax=Tritonibacter horizontis TaxID=1768241 RepID=A0A132BSK5_9RHOB|nr:hypothetical protein TRIHO_38680 [Tritonibacter horizontis]